MAKGRIRSTAPYVVGLVAAAILYGYAQRIEFTPRPGQLGADFWPKLAIALMAVVCLVEIVKGLLGGRAEARGIADTLDADGAAEAAGPRFPWLLAGGIALLSAYAVLVAPLGFLLATFAFLAAFMYLGRYRNHVAIWAISAAMMLLIAAVFQRFAYVSLPRGVPPFDRFTDFVRTILGG
jgi:putative tricarboxylic transport membrane protein